MKRDTERSGIRDALRDPSQQEETCLAIDELIRQFGSQEKAAKSLGLSVRTFQRAVRDRMRLAELYPRAEKKREPPRRSKAS